MTPAPNVWPALRYDDAPAAVRFLVDVLGFTETLVVPDGDLVAHAELRWPEGGAVMLGSVRQPDGVHDAMKPGTGAVYVVSDHVDDIHAKAQAMRRRDHRRADGHGLRLAHVQPARPGGQRLDVRHLPRRILTDPAAAIGRAVTGPVAARPPGSTADGRPGRLASAGSALAAGHGRVESSARTGKSGRCRKRQPARWLATLAAECRRRRIRRAPAAVG